MLYFKEDIKINNKIDILPMIDIIFSNYFNSLWQKQNSILNQYCGRFEMLYRTNNL